MVCTHLLSYPFHRSGYRTRCACPVSVDHSVCQGTSIVADHSIYCLSPALSQRCELGEREANIQPFLLCCQAVSPRNVAISLPEIVSRCSILGHRARWHSLRDSRDGKDCSVP